MQNNQLNQTPDQPQETTEKEMTVGQFFIMLFAGLTVAFAIIYAIWLFFCLLYHFTK